MQPKSNTTSHSKVAIAGASGFVGSILISHLLEQTNYNIVALSRSEYNGYPDPRIVWKKCDLFSLIDTEEALSDCDAAIYLVHSMLPSAHLVQGDFPDFDSLLADNFARAIQNKGIEQIIYLGGILPKDGPLSRHLESRREVEQILMSYGAHVTVLRAGMIVGPGGSSFQIMSRLIERLPLLLCPSWTQSLAAPIGVKDVVNSILFCLYNHRSYDKIYDLQGDTLLSYEEMMKILAEKLGKKRVFLKVPIFSLKLSRLWVSLITGAPRNLTYPLIMSLKSPMEPDKNRLLTIPNKPPESFERILETSLQNVRKVSPRAYSFHGSSEDNEVRSIQRLPNPSLFTAEEVGENYFSWLARFLRPFIKVKKVDTKVFFCLIGLKKVLLELRFSEKRSSPNRSLYYIEGGVLAKAKGRGRLEFRNLLDGRYTLVAIHEYKPFLPWYVYKYTQALIHRFIMYAFAQHLRNKPRK